MQFIIKCDNIVLTNKTNVIYERKCDFMKTNFKINMYDVRKMCIEMQFCTYCDYEQYDELLNMCNFELKSFETLKKRLYEIATLINEYSHNQTIENIMFCLMNDCVTTFFEFD